MDELLNKKNLNLLKELTLSNFKLRNEGSVLGIFWYLLNPLLMLIVLYFIFSKNIGSSIQNYAFYVLIGVIQWNFFSSSTSDGMLSFERYKELVKKVNFPRELLVISSVFNIFLSHLIEWGLLLILLIFISGITYNLIFLPIILLLELILSLTLSLILSVAISYYRDIEGIWKNVLFVGWFLTPIFYAKEIIPNKFSFINIINPLTHIITFARTISINNKQIDLLILSFIFLCLIILFILSYIIFKKLVINVAERI